MIEEKYILKFQRVYEEEYNEKKVTIEKVKTKFNVDLKVDDLDE
jgi:hypothetical protein